MICFPGDINQLVRFVPLKPLNKSCSQDVVALKTNIARTLLTGEISFVEDVYLGCLDDCRFGRLRVEAFFFNFLFLHIAMLCNVVVFHTTWFTRGWLINVSHVNMLLLFMCFICKPWYLSKTSRCPFFAFMSTTPSDIM